MAQFSFDIESTYDIGEMNNVFDQSQKELTNRYDLKGTHTEMEWLEDKSGIKIFGNVQFHLDAVIDMLRKKAATRGVSQKTFDVSQSPETTNLRMIWKVPFKNGLKQDDVMSPKKDELQQAMQLLQSKEFDFPVLFTNFR
jgi:uncharacterized protein YajQ (UPF0234 family)